MILKGGILANPPASVTNLLKQAEPDLFPASWDIRFGKCEEVCPQHIQIREELAKAAELFGQRKEA